MIIQYFLTYASQKQKGNTMIYRSENPNGVKIQETTFAEFCLKILLLSWEFSVDKYGTGKYTAKFVKKIVGLILTRTRKILEKLVKPQTVPSL